MGLWYLDCFQHTPVILIKVCDSLHRGLQRCIRTMDSSNPRILPTTGPLDANLHPIIPRLLSQHLPHGQMQAASQAPVRLPRASRMRQPGTQDRGASNALARFSLLSQAGPPEGADLELPAVSGLRDLRCLRPQLLSLLRLPIPLRHGCVWCQQLICDSE